MYKLTGHGLTRGEWFVPESQPMTLTERNSSCSITLGPLAPEIGFDDWILDDDWPEGPTVWRVKSIDDQVDKETVTVQMEHVIRRLEDIKLFAGASPADMGGEDTVPAKTVISWILSHQSDWRLGDFGYPADYALPYEFSGGESLLDAIESVTETLEDSEWWYDMSVYPFLLHIRRRSAVTASEMRGGRNLSTLRRSMNRSGMYTRIYPVGQNDMHLPEEYLSENESVYGRVDKIETDQGKTTEEGLRAWAAGRLRRHCEPVVTVTISGLELSQETGEALDTITVNRVCRCPLPEYRTTILERVIKKAWRDRRADPESVTVTLGNNSADVTDLTKVLEAGSKTSGRSARGQAKQNYLFEANGEHLLYEVFDECGHLHGILRMTEQSLRIAFENLNSCTRSEFKLTSESLRLQFENLNNSTRSELQMTSESLRLQFENLNNSTRSELQMTSESLRIAFENLNNCTRSEFLMTSESMRISFENDVASVRSSLEMTASSLRTAFENDINSTRSEFQQTSESMRIAFANDVTSVRSEMQITASSLRVQFENDVSSVRSLLEMTASSLRTVFESDIDSVRSEVTQTDSSWKAAVAGVAGKDGKITAASIGVAINKDGSNAFINADHIHITGDTLLSGHLSVKDGHLSVDTALSVGNTTGKIVTINNGAINAPTVQVNSGGKLLLVGNSENARVELTYTGIQEYIKKAELSTDGKTLKLYKVSDSSTPSITFSKATTLEWAWSGGKYTVDAYQTNNGTKTKVGSDSTTLSDQYTVSGNISRCNADGTVNANGQYVKRGIVVQYVKPGTDGGEAEHLSTGRTLEVVLDASSVYTAGDTAGKNAVNINKGTWSGGVIQFTKSAGTPSTKEVRLVAATPSWSGNTATVAIWDGTGADAQHGSNTGYSVTVDATARYNAGNANRNSQILTPTATPDAGVETQLSANTVYTFQSQYQKADGTWGTGGTYVIKTAAGTPTGNKNKASIAVEANVSEPSSSWPTDQKITAPNYDKWYKFTPRYYNSSDTPVPDNDKACYIKIPADRYQEGVGAGYNNAARYASWIDYFASESAAQAAKTEDGVALPYGDVLTAGGILGLYYVKADGTKYYKAYWKVPEAQGAGTITIPRNECYAKSSRDAGYELWSATSGYLVNYRYAHFTIHCTCGASYNGCIMSPKF